jgi:hypothetical protein
MKKGNCNHAWGNVFSKLPKQTQFISLHITGYPGNILYVRKGREFRASLINEK